MQDKSSVVDFPGRLERWRKLLPYALLLSVTLALYGPSLYFDFVWDDLYYVLKNYQIQGFSWQHLRTIWTGTYLGHYAPIHHSFLAILYHFFGAEPFGYHLGQLLVHGACVCLLYSVVKKLESARVALLACLLFAVYPANIETVAWISETKSTLAFFFFLVAFWLFLRLRESGRWGYGVWCGCFLVLSWLSKINTVVAPAIFLCWDYKQGTLLKKDRLRSLAVFFLLSAIFVGVHLASFYRSSPSPERSPEDVGFGVRMFNVPLYIAFYLQMLVFPHPLSAWQMFPAAQQLTWAVGIAWIGVPCLLAILSRSNRTIQFWGLWFLVFLAPVLQLFPFGIWVADRYLYIPAVGAFVLASKGFWAIRDRWTRLWPRVGWEAAMGGILLAFAWHTRNHLPVWRTDLNLWGTTLLSCMSSPYCHNNLGSVLLTQGRTEMGVKELIRAVELRPIPRYLMKLGDAYTLAVRDYRQALIAYRMALEKGGPEIDADFYARLARIHLLMGDWEEARHALQAGREIDPNSLHLLVVSAFFHWKQNNLESARQDLRRAYSLAGTNINLATFVNLYWGADASEVGRLLAALGPSTLGDHP